MRERCPRIRRAPTAIDRLFAAVHDLAWDSQLHTTIHDLVEGMVIGEPDFVERAEALLAGGGDEEED